MGIVVRFGELTFEVDTEAEATALAEQLGMTPGLEVQEVPMPEAVPEEIVGEVESASTMIAPPSNFVPAARLIRESRSVTLPNKRTSQLQGLAHEVAAKIDADPIYPPGIERPRTRGDCIDGPRPCPWVSCSKHLFLDVSNEGSLKLNFADLEPHELPETCSLDVADRGGATLEEIGGILNLTRERIRQTEVYGLKVLKAASQRIGVEDPIERFCSPAGAAIDN